MYTYFYICILKLSAALTLVVFDLLRSQESEKIEIWNGDPNSRSLERAGRATET